MKKKFLAAAPAVSVGIRKTETAHRFAVLQLGQLKVSMLEAHQHAELDFIEGQNVLSDVSKAEMLMTEAWFHIGRAHVRSAELMRSRGVDPSMFGDVYPCPDKETKREQGAAPADLVEG